MTLAQRPLAARLSIAGKPGSCADEFASWNTTSQVCRRVPFVAVVVPADVGRDVDSAENCKANCVFLCKNSEPQTLEFRLSNSRSSSRNV